MQKPKSIKILKKQLKYLIFVVNFFKNLRDSIKIHSLDVVD